MKSLIHALSQCVSHTAGLHSLKLVGLPIYVPYLNPLVEALSSNRSLQNICLSRCCLGDAGCSEICNVLRRLPNVSKLDLSGCNLTFLGAHSIAKLIIFQKLHRYDESWKNSLRYRLPQLEAMAGVRRINLCSNPGIADRGFGYIVEALSDDLWIKAVDMQNCGLGESSAESAKQLLRLNNKLVILDLRNNAGISPELLMRIKISLRNNESSIADKQYRWLDDSSHSVTNADRPNTAKTLPIRSSTANAKTRNNNFSSSIQYKFTGVLSRKDKEYIRSVHEQLQREIWCRRELEVSMERLVQQITDQLQGDYSNTSVGSDLSVDQSAHSDSSTFVPIDRTTLLYIQKVFSDIYIFIRNNQCQGNCHIYTKSSDVDNELYPNTEDLPARTSNVNVTVPVQVWQGDHSNETRTREVNRRARDSEKHVMSVFIKPKHAKSEHVKFSEHSTSKAEKVSKSACLIGESYKKDKPQKHKVPLVIEKTMGDTPQRFRDGIELLEALCSEATLTQNKRRPEEKLMYSSSSSEDSDETTSPPSNR